MGLSYSNKYENEYAVKDALLCGIAYMQLIKMKNSKRMKPINEEY